MPQPYFFVFDGIDGAGKTTQIQRFQAWLEAEGHEVLVCRDPGSTELGERIRELLLNSKGIAIDNHAEMLLYMAARAQLVQQVVRPALARGASVVSDRFLLANVVYQGHAGGMSPDSIWQVGRIATDDLAPTLTIVLDIDPQVAAERRQGPPDRLELRGTEYFHRVRAGFLAEAERHPGMIALVNADRAPDQVAQAVQQAATCVMQSPPGNVK